MTNIQKQCLLRYLGYYSGSIDGIFGSQSRQATVDFQTAYGLEADGIFGEAAETVVIKAVAGEVQPRDPWEGIRHFTREEFRCKCGGKYCDGFPAEPSGKLLRLADRVRSHFGAAAMVSSGVRCEAHNANVGGVEGSRHLTGSAMDFRVAGKTADAVLAYVHAQPETRYAYAIDDTYIHMDVN